MVNRWRRISIRRYDMNVVILGILTKTILLALGAFGLLLGLVRRARGSGRRVLPPVLLALRPDLSPVRVNTRRLINMPSRAPPGSEPPVDLFTRFGSC